ncbi:MAG: ACT domain-containing protein [Gammaproteobacteria bacterium]|nr:ACT domain-containing protein [Gammaproteobacteria bacterium]
MIGEMDIDKLLALLQPALLDGEYVFCSSPSLGYGDLDELQPISCYQEQEGLSLLLSKSAADSAGLSYSSVFCGITLSVHSSLDAVGFTAAVAKKLARNGISANVIAAHYHDHVFVPADKAKLALALLREFES